MRLSEKYFTDDELKCKGSSVLKLDPIFDKKLTELREVFGQPMIVNSCCRSATYNAKVGGVPGSFHVYDSTVHKTNGTCAIDIKRQSKEYDDNLIRTAWAQNWSIGLHPAFIHLDCRADVVNSKKLVFKYSGKTDEAEYEHYKSTLI